MRFVKKTAKFLLLCVLAGGILHIPLNTKQGVDFKVMTVKIPLYAKYCGFFYRDYQYRALSRSITKGIRSDREKITAVYSWTVENIRRHPEGFPIIDDHIWDIMVRRYGVADQMADVFTTLTSYSGYESFFASPKVSRYVVLSFVNIGGEWHMFDIYNKKAFISGDGLDAPAPSGLTYREALDEIDPALFEVNLTRRADKQKFIPRVIYESRRFKETVFRLKDSIMEKVRSL